MKLAELLGGRKIFERMKAIQDPATPLAAGDVVQCGLAEPYFFLGIPLVVTCINGDAVCADARFPGAGATMICPGRFGPDVLTRIGRMLG